MKIQSLTLCLLIALSFSTSAVDFEVLEPCTGKVKVSSKIEATYYNVGLATVGELGRLGVDFVGSELGVHSMYGTPVGEQALEIISRLEMRSYGWCYEVDGEVPEVLPFSFPMDKEMKKITWFFGYATYVAGEWKGQCDKVSELKPAFICSSTEDSK